MTICIAAIGNSNEEECIIFATDHMITTQIGQFEHSIDKYKPITNNIYAMIAGEALLFDDLIKRDDRETDYEFIKKSIFKNIKDKKREVIKNEILSIFDVNEEFF